MKRKFKRRVVYLFSRVIAAFLSFLPMRLTVLAGGCLGIFGFYILKRHRLATLENLKFAFEKEKSAKEIYSIARDVFMNLGKGLAEFISFPKINKFNIDRFVTPCGIEKIDEALRQKRGVIAIACHLGNWELEAAYFGLNGYPANTIVRPSRYESYDRFINSIRRSKNVNIIPREHSFKKLLSILKENQIIGILPDQDIDSVAGVFVDFFGRKAYTPIGPVLLAIASKSPLFPVFCIRQNGTHRLIVEDPIELEITGDKEKDIVVNTQKWSRVVERYIRQYPQQWVWMHKRWKTQQK